MNNLGAPKDTEVVIRAGNHSCEWLVRPDGIDVELCTCRQDVFAFGDLTTSLIGGPLAVTETRDIEGETYFVVSLTPEQTATLNTTDANTHRTWVAEIIGGEEVISAYTYEIHRKLVVTPQALP